jgi:hypothetical protein
MRRATLSATVIAVGLAGCGGSSGSHVTSTQTASTPKAVAAATVPATVQKPVTHRKKLVHHAPASAGSAATTRHPSLAAVKSTIERTLHLAPAPKRQPAVAPVHVAPVAAPPKTATAPAQQPKTKTTTSSNTPPKTGNVAQGY